MSRPRLTDGLRIAWSRVIPLLVLSLLCLSGVVLAGSRLVGWAVDYNRQIRAERTETDRRRIEEQHRLEVDAANKRAVAAQEQLRSEQQRRSAAEQQAELARLAREEEQRRLGEAEAAVTASAEREALESERRKEEERKRTEAEEQSARLAAERAQLQSKAQELEALIREGERARAANVVATQQRPDPALTELGRKVDSASASAAQSASSPADDAYLRAAEQLRGAAQLVANFERTNGGTEQTRNWSSELTQQLRQLVVTCQADNNVNRQRRQKMVPCPR